MAVPGLCARSRIWNCRVIPAICGTVTREVYDDVSCAARDAREPGQRRWLLGAKLLEATERAK